MKLSLWYLKMFGNQKVIPISRRRIAKVQNKQNQNWYSGEIKYTRIFSSKYMDAHVYRRY